MKLRDLIKKSCDRLNAMKLMNHYESECKAWRLAALMIALKRGGAFCYPHGPITGFCAKMLLYQQLPEV